MLLGDKPSRIGYFVGVNMPLLFAVTPLRHNIEGGIEICCCVNIKNMQKSTKILLIKHKN